MLFECFLIYNLKKGTAYIIKVLLSLILQSYLKPTDPF